MFINNDINSYFDYVNEVIDNSNVVESEKKYYREMISFYKVSGRMTVDYFEDYSDYSNVDFEEELYILYELLSFRFYKLLNYRAWRKRKIFGIL